MRGAIAVLIVAFLLIWVGATLIIDAWMGHQTEAMRKRYVASKHHTIQVDFVPDRLQPLPESLLREIDELTSHYGSTGERDGDGE